MRQNERVGRDFAVIEIFEFDRGAERDDVRRHFFGRQNAGAIQFAGEALEVFGFGGIGGTARVQKAADAAFVTVTDNDFLFHVITLLMVENETAREIASSLKKQEEDREPRLRRDCEG